jgi:transcriptional regulator with XRE-family HTH domain
MNELKNVTTYAAVIGAVLVNLRNDKKLNQSDVASVVGVSSSTWSRIEKGDSSLSVDQLYLAAKALKIRPEQILELASKAEEDLPSKGIEVISWADFTSNRTLTSAVALGLLPVGGTALAAVIVGVMGYLRKKNEK